MFRLRQFPRLGPMLPRAFRQRQVFPVCGYKSSSSHLSESKPYTDAKAILETMSSQLSTLQEDFKTLNGKLDALIGVVHSVDGLSESFGTTSKIFDTSSGKFDGLRGQTNKWALRGAIGETYGLEYTRTFSTMGLCGLVNLVIESKTTLLGTANEPDTYSSDIQLISKGTKQLIDFIFSRQDAIVPRLTLAGVPDVVCRSIFLDRKKLPGSAVEELKALQANSEATHLTRVLCHYALSDKTDRREQLESDNGVGMLLLSAAVGIDPVHNLALDCRPFIQQTALNEFTVTCFEMRSSHIGISKAIDQLGRNLTILSSVIEVVAGAKIKRAKKDDASASANGNGNDHDHDTAMGNGKRPISITKVGVIVLPGTERKEFEVPPKCDFWLEFLYS